MAGRVSFGWLDGVILVCAALLGGAIAWTLVEQMGSAFFLQPFTPEALMWACGHGLRHPASLTPEMVSFLLKRSTATFDCASIPSNLPSGPPGIFFYLQLYLSLTAAGLWRCLGTTQMAIAPLAALLGAGYTTGNYMLARQFLPRWFAAVAMLVLALSPVTTGQIFYLRDFSKAPFLVWAITLLFLSLRQATLKGRIVAALLAGAVAGTGCGFRADVAIMLPLGIALLAIAPRLGTTARAGLLGAFAIGFVLLASPLLIFGKGSSSGMLVMQGATEPFRAFLALRPAPYALGSAYSDELTLSAVAAEERSIDPGWDAAEPAAVYGISQSVTRSSESLTRWAPHFPADFMAQALKGAVWILGYPALVAVSRGSADPGTPLRLDVPIVHWQEPFYALLGQPWMPAVGFIGVLAWLLRVTATRGGREAWATAGLLLALLTYPVVQFSVRHIFYLEFVWVVGLLSIPRALWEWRSLRPVSARFALSVTLVLALLAGAYEGVARLQQRWLTADFSDLLALPREEVAVLRTVQADGAVLLRVPVPPAEQATVDGAPDSMTPRIAEVGIEYDVRAGGERMLMTFGGPSCPPGPARIGLQYDHRPDAWQPLDSTLVIPPGAVAVFPAFYRATQNFAGVLIPKSHAACEVDVSRLPMTLRLPLVLTAVLPANWRSLPLRKGLGLFGPGSPS